MAVPAGKPVSVPLKLAVPPVIAPAPSRVTTNVTFITPLAPASALLTGGTSLAELSVARNSGSGCPDGSVGPSSSQAIDPNATIRARAAIERSRFMAFAPKSEELASEVEAQVQAVGR